MNDLNLDKQELTLLIHSLILKRNEWTRCANSPIEWQREEGKREIKIIDAVCKKLEMKRREIEDREREQIHRDLM